MIEATQLVRRFVVKKSRQFRSVVQEEITAVDGVNLNIERGEIVALLGMNGAGKTTTIKMLSTLLKPTSGTIAMDGIDVVSQPSLARPLINMVAGGEKMLYWRLTGKENLVYFARLYGYGGHEAAQRAIKLLGMVGLSEAADLAVERYSKGMKQRLQVARGLINDPRYLFLDEPTLGLDAPIAREIRNLVRELAREHNRGILLTSHYMAEVEELSDRIYLLHRGRIIQQGKPEQLRVLSGEQVKYNLTLSGVNAANLDNCFRDLGVNGLKVTQAEGTTHVEFNAPQEFPQEHIFRAVTALDADIVDFRTLEPSLEDVVVALVGETA